jgi:sugar lactone lactonase YvrE
MVFIELVADYACQIGENPIWHSAEQALYWLDISQGRIFRYDAQSKTHDIFYEGNVIGGMTIQDDGTLLLFMERGRITRLKAGKLQTVIESIEAEVDNRFNDVIATPSGAVYCGTLSNRPNGVGRLYYLDKDANIHPVIHDVGIANGMGFSPDFSRFYFTDSSPARTIYRYQFDQSSDEISSPTVFARPKESDGLPDGLTVDVDGFIWSACWDGGKLIRYTPSGKIDLEIEIPHSAKVSSLTFGRADYSDAYVTTAGGDEKAANGKNAGALFCVQIEGIAGRPEYRSRIIVRG